MVGMFCQPLALISFQLQCWPGLILHIMFCFTSGNITLWPTLPSVRSVIDPLPGRPSYANTISSVAGPLPADNITSWLAYPCVYSVTAAVPSRHVYVNMTSMAGPLYTEDVTPRPAFPCVNCVNQRNARPTFLCENDLYGRAPLCRCPHCPADLSLRWLTKCCHSRPPLICDHKMCSQSRDCEQCHFPTDPSLR